MAYVHNLSPFAIEIGSGYGLRWYGLSYLAGFAAAYLIFRLLSKKSLTPLTKDQTGDFLFTLAMGTIVGGRLGYCLLYDQSLITRFSGTFPFWGVLEIHKGGMASHGGILGIALAALYFARKTNLPMMHLWDLCALGGTVGIFFGRLANFVNGELLGRPSDPSLPWAVKFPQDILAWPYEAPERLQGLGPVIQRLGLNESWWSSAVSTSPTSHSIYAALNQIIDSIQRGNSAVTMALEPLLTARHPSQLYEALLEGVFLFLAMWSIWLRRWRSGSVAAAFLILYPLVRILGEQFRMPDAQIGFEWLGLTRGQWLSVGMLAAGIAFAVWAASSASVSKSENARDQARSS